MKRPEIAFDRHSNLWTLRQTITNVIERWGTESRVEVLAFKRVIIAWHRPGKDRSR